MVPAPACTAWMAWSLPKPVASSSPRSPTAGSFLRLPRLTLSPLWPRGPGVSSTLRNSSVIALICSSVDSTKLAPSVPRKWTSRIGWSAENSASLSSRSTSEARAQRRVGARVAPEDLDQPVALVDQLGGGDLLLGLAQEVLLAGRAHDVGVLVAEAHVLERLAPAHALVAGLDVDVGVLGGVVEVAPVDVHVDAADRVDRAPEAAEVHVDHVVDRQAGDRLDGLERELGPAELVGGVDLVRAVAGDLDLEVARQRQDRRGLLVRVEAHEHDRVRARAARALGVVAAAAGRSPGSSASAACRGRSRRACPCPA